MPGNLMAGRYGKHHHRTKKFLEDACTMIELSNLVESLKLGHIKLHEPCFYDNKDTCKGIQRAHMEANRETKDESAFVSRPKSKSRLQATRQTGPTSNNLRATKSIKKTIKSKSCTFDLKELSKYELQGLQAEILQNRQTKKCSHKRQSLSPSSKKDINKSTAVKEKVVKRQLLASNLDMARYRQLYCIKDLSRHEKVPITSIVPLPKTDLSKCSVKTWKSFPSFSDTCLLNKVSMKQISKNRDTVYRVNERDPKKPANKKPSLQIKVNLQLKSNSNTMNLQIKSKVKDNSDALDFRLPLQYDSSARQEEISKITNTLSTNFSTERSISTPSAQTSNDREIQFLKPYAKTQAVYNVYDVTTYQQPGKVKGIRSHISFSMNIGRSPQAGQGRMYTDEVRSLPTPSPSGRLAGNRQVLYNSKVNMNSGATSMQQSFSLGRSSPQTESPYESQVCSQVCNCAQNGSGFGLSDTQSAVCDTCCQANVFQRTRQRIADRVGPVSSDARSIIFSPRAFFKRIYEKYKCINNKVEEQMKSVGSCTCSPFQETEQFTVQEENVDPECSLLKRVFGTLIFSNKCVVCTENKKIGTKYRPLKPYECEPGTCVEKEPKKSPFACFKKFCKKKGPKEDDKKKKGKMSAKEKAKKDKAKALEKQKRAKAKAKKELDRKNALKKKMKTKKDREKLKAKESGTSFISSIFKNPEEDDDRQKLLNDEGKKRRRDGDKKSKSDTKGKDEGGTDFENKAKKTLVTTRRGYRRVTRRIRERYYRNKKLAEEQKGQYACDFYLMSLRNKPCLWVYYLCPVCYPYCLQALNVWRQVSDLLLFFVAIIVWSPCILCAECLKVLACNMCVS